MNLLILGASARAAAQSAIRAGLSPACGDLFADRDLAAIAPARRVEPARYPEALETIASEAPPGPWLYTGALENHPELVDRIGRRRPLWGNPGDILKAVRDPGRVAEVLRRAGLPCPAVRSTDAGLTCDGRWLVKPIASAGGRRIQPLLADSTGPIEPSYYQERIEGTSCSAIFVGLPGAANFLGATYQWIGKPGSAFAFVGNLGPRPLSASLRSRIESMGRALATSFGLRGLFGVDFIERDGIPWPVEINPRYTASVEVLELATGLSLLAEHRRAFEPGLTDSPDPRPGHHVAVGKAILFAPAPCGCPRFDRDRPAFSSRFESIADIPRADETFRPGEPVMSLFAHGTSLDACRHRLMRYIDHWEARLSRWSNSGRSKHA